MDEIIALLEATGLRGVALDAAVDIVMKYGDEQYAEGYSAGDSAGYSEGYGHV